MGQHQPHNRQTAQDDEGKKENANERTRYYFPFRWFQHILRDAEREDAHRGGDRDYHKPSNSDLRGALRRGGKLWAKVRSGWTAEGWIAVFTIVLVAETYYQWKAMREQNDIMQDHIKIERRAWIGAHNPPLTKIAPDKPVQTYVPAENTGATPGRIEFANLEILKLPKDADISADVARIFRGARTLRQEIVIAPQATSGLTPHIATTYPPEAVASIEAGDWKLWIIGRFTYRDIFDSRHFTEFCYVFDPGDSTNPDDGRMVGHFKYNDMGDEPNELTNHSSSLSSE